MQKKMLSLIFNKGETVLVWEFIGAFSWLFLIFLFLCTELVK